jgi:hypothetical protein
MATARAVLERRRSSRIQIQIPVKVVRSETRDTSVNALSETPAEAVSVSRYGALLRMPFLPDLGSRIEILHDVSQEVREFRVISVRNEIVKRDSAGNKEPQKFFELGVEILYPAQNFWGVRFPDDRHTP